jgi:hypothetical protein
MRNALLLRRIVLWFLVAAIALPPSPAAAASGPGNWSKVTALKPETHLIVTVIGRPGPPQSGSDPRRAVEGWCVSADASGLVLRPIEDTWTQPKGMYTPSADVAIPRARVVQVVVVKEGRPWYAIPLVVAAVAGGVVLCFGTLWALAGSGSGEWPTGDDSPYGWLTIFALPVVMGVWAYRKTDDIRRSEKVIYEAPQPAGRAGV